MLATTTSEKRLFFLTWQISANTPVKKCRRLACWAAFSPLYYVGVAAHGLVTLVIGVVCVLGSRYVGTLLWAIILLVLGIVATGIGGRLVILGALLGLASNLVKKSH